MRREIVSQFRIWSLVEPFMFNDLSDSQSFLRIFFKHSSKQVLHLWTHILKLLKLEAEFVFLDYSCMNIKSIGWDLNIGIGERKLVWNQSI